MDDEPNETKNALTSDQEPVVPQQSSAPENGGYLGWFLLEIAPIPIGLLIGGMRIFDSAQNGSKALFVAFGVLTLLCSVVGGVGQFGGFKKKSFRHIALGIIAGLGIAVFDVFVVLFIGCCSSIGNIH